MHFQTPVSLQRDRVCHDCTCNVCEMRSTKSPLLEKGVPCARHLGAPFKRLRSSSILGRHMHPVRTWAVNGVTKPTGDPPIIHCMWEAPRLTKHFIIGACSGATKPAKDPAIIHSIWRAHCFTKHVMYSRLTHADMLCVIFLRLTHADMLCVVHFGTFLLDALPGMARSLSPSEIQNDASNCISGGPRLDRSVDQAMHKNVYMR